MSNDRKGYVDYQQRASEFSVGDLVYPFMSGNHSLNGRVMAVWPAIGMVDVEWPHGSERKPVEELQRYESKDFIPPEAGHDNVPGGADSVSVPGGPVEKAASVDLTGLSRRVAEAFVKKSIYWGAKDRKYRATKAEIEAGKFCCPKCRADGVTLRKVNYKRTEGMSSHLLGCPSCLFVIKKCDLIGHPDFVALETEEVA